MRMTVLEAQHLCRRRLLNARAMWRLLQTPRFEDAVKAATDEHLKRLEVILKSENGGDLKNWVRDSLNKSLYDRNIRELISLARDLMIPKYSRMSRAQLIRAIEKHQQG